jgi:hypothetical protein
MTDADDHTRRLAAAAVAYLHCCARTPGPRDHAGEYAVLLEMIAAMVTKPQQYDIDLDAIVKSPEPFPQRLPDQQEDAPEQHAAFEYSIGRRRKRHRWPADRRQSSG